MKKFITVLALVGLVASASPAFANWQANLSPTNSSFSVGGGGSFGITFRDLAGAPPIPTDLKFGASLGETWNAGTLSDNYGRTFCIESVNLSSNTWYYATIDADIKNGLVVDSVVPFLTLQNATRRVFSNYVLNTSAFQTIKTTYASLNWGSYFGSWNKVMQALFWDAQHVQGSTGAKFYNELNATQQGAYNALVAISASGREADVRALNLWVNPDFTGDKQSQLVLVPVPAAAVLGFLGLSIVGWASRKLK